EVRDSQRNQPLAITPLQVRILVDDKEIKADVAPHATDASGFAAIRLTLPQSAEIRHANITIVATGPNKNPETIVRSIPLTTRRLNVEFFPEGGSLIAGVPNRVYFRVATTTSPSRPADASGVLTDGINDICEIKTLTDKDHPGVNQGLGVFSFTPELGKRY